MVTSCGVTAVSRVNEPAQTGPYYARIRPVEQHQKQAGGQPQGHTGDMLVIRGGHGIPGPEVVHPVPGSSRAYLVIVGLVAVMLGAGAFWGGPLVLAGVGLGWVTAMLIWMVRADLISEFQELFW